MIGSVWYDHHGACVDRKTYSLRTSGSHFAGLTVTELLVAIGVVALLLATTLPAIQAARASARRVQCSNNLKQLSLGVHGFEAREEYLPPAFTDIAANDPSLRKHNLIAFLLHDIGQVELASLYNFEFHWFEALRPTPETANVVLANAAIEVASCPAVPSGRSKASSDYTVCLWLATTENSAIYKLVGPKRVSRRHEWSSVLSPFLGSRHEFARIHRGMITDGMSNSMMLFEDAGRPNYYVSGAEVEGSGRVPITGALWADADAPFAVHNVCGQSVMNCNNDNEIYAFHAGGTNIAFGDASVRFISATISPDAFASLLTRAADDLVRDRLGESE